MQNYIIEIIVLYYSSNKEYKQKILSLDYIKVLKKLLPIFTSKKAILV